MAVYIKEEFKACFVSVTYKASFELLFHASIVTIGHGSSLNSWASTFIDPSGIKGFPHSKERKGFKRFTLCGENLRHLQSFTPV
ncbi:MAG: hypothetical protein GY795_20520 [Desulfobacterales bacterium]|nr:hypothetical protein [Desulfobacterales bacterium]